LAKRPARWYTRDTLLHGRNIVCISTIDWDYLWQQHQAVMSVFARNGNRILFVENTGVRVPRWRDRDRIGRRLKKALGGAGRFRSVVPNVVLYSPLALPFPYSRLAQYWNRTFVARGIRDWMRANGFVDPILFSFLPTQFTLDLVDLLAPAASVFYCSDKFSETSPAARPIVPYEHRVLERSDLVFASSYRLIDYCRAHNPRTHLFTIGVSLDRFEDAWRGNIPVPEDLACLAGPRIGLVGGLRACVDQQLLGELARRLPHATIVLIGPEQIPFDEVRRFPNVHLLGQKPHVEIPSYVRGLDVCVIPYVVDHFTDHISPAKLNEYLALGKPVVATGLHEVRRFAEAHEGAVTIADGPDAFTNAVEVALRDDSPDSSARRRAVAESQSWDIKVEGMSQWIEKALASRQRGAPRN
jgi:glycosyltransferase involved in cell wall biosynthesis